MSEEFYGVTPTASVLQANANAKRDSVKGVKFPFATSGYSVNKSVGMELAKSQIKQVIFTKPGERVMLPNYGVDLESYLFDQFDEEIIDDLRRKIASNIDIYVPEVNILRLEITETEDIKYSGLPGIRILLVVSLRDTGELDRIEIEP